MLRNVTRKLCPFISLALAIGCGKKITDSSGDVTRSSEAQNRSSSWILRLETANGPSKVFEIPQNGNSHIPEALKVQANGTGRKVKMTYHFDPEFPDDFSLECTYSSVDNPYLLTLEKCLNVNGVNVGDVSNFELTFYYTQKIKMELVGSPVTGLVIDSFYSVDWQ